MPLDANDRQQLLEATQRGRCILTFNVGDFVRLSQEFPEHGGIILAQQTGLDVGEIDNGRLTASLSAETTAEMWPGQVRWLNDWR